MKVPRLERPASRQSSTQEGFDQLYLARCLAEAFLTLSHTPTGCYPSYRKRGQQSWTRPGLQRCVLECHKGGETNLLLRAEALDGYFDPYTAAWRMTDYTGPHPRHRTSMCWGELSGLESRVSAGRKVIISEGRPLSDRLIKDMIRSEEHAHYITSLGFPASPWLAVQLRFPMRIAHNLRQFSWFINTEALHALEDADLHPVFWLGDDPRDLIVALFFDSVRSRRRAEHLEPNLPWKLKISEVNAEMDRIRAGMTMFPNKFASDTASALQGLFRCPNMLFRDSTRDAVPMPMVGRVIRLEGAGLLKRLEMRRMTSLFDDLPLSRTPDCLEELLASVARLRRPGNGEDWRTLSGADKFCYHWLRLIRQSAPLVGDDNGRQPQQTYPRYGVADPFRPKRKSQNVPLTIIPGEESKPDGSTSLVRNLTPKRYKSEVRAYRASYASTMDRTSSDWLTVDFDVFDPDGNRIVVDEVMLDHLVDLDILAEVRAEGIHPILALSGQGIYVSAFFTRKPNKSEMAHVAFYLERILKGPGPGTEAHCKDRGSWRVSGPNERTYHVCRDKVSYASLIRMPLSWHPKSHRRVHLLRHSSQGWQGMSISEMTVLIREIRTGALRSDPKKLIESLSPTQCLPTLPTNQSIPHPASSSDCPRLPCSKNLYNDHRGDSELCYCVGDFAATRISDLLNASLILLPEDAGDFVYERGVMGRLWKECVGDRAMILELLETAIRRAGQEGHRSNRLSATERAIRLIRRVVNEYDPLMDSASGAGTALFSRPLTRNDKGGLVLSRPKQALLVVCHGIIRGKSSFAYPGACDLTLMATIMTESEYRCRSPSFAIRSGFSRFAGGK